MFNQVMNKLLASLKMSLRSVPNFLDANKQWVKQGLN